MVVAVGARVRRKPAMAGHELYLRKRELPMVRPMRKVGKCGSPEFSEVRPEARQLADQLGPLPPRHDQQAQ